jgi:serine phosphatase RsbU (regulator of sigma subunit)
MAKLAPSLRQLLGGSRRPSELLELLNAVACHQFADDMFASAVCAHFDMAERVAQIANAGHISPLLLRAGETRLCAPASAPPLGMREHLNSSDDMLRIRDGDSLLLMTDGVLESLESDLLNMPNISSHLRQAPDIIHLGRSLLKRALRSQSCSDDATLLGLQFSRGRSTHFESAPLSNREG